MPVRHEDDALSRLCVLQADAAWKAWFPVGDIALRAAPGERLVVEREEILELIEP
jgi:hypothetical protein